MLTKGDRGEFGARGTSRAKLVIILAAVALLVIGFIVLAIWESDHNKFPDRPVLEKTLTYQGQEYVLREDVETMLVLGLDSYANEDSGSYNNDKQADFLLLLVIDPSEEICRAIRINRDTMAIMNVLGVAGDKIGTATKQIALAHTYGNGREVSCRNTADAVSDLLWGARVDHYVSVTMEAIPLYTDLLGGVTLEILEDFSGVDPSLVQGETMTLSGEQALTYIRSRYGMEDPTNQSRMKRQKQYLEAVYAKTREVMAEDESFLSHTALKMTEFLVSDCSGNRLESLLDRLSGYELDTILDISGENRVGEEFMEFYPDSDSVMAVVVECFYELKQ
jgi:LCP family protein required for cell wall assembly